MKNSHLMGEVVLSVLLLVLTILFLNPLQALWMPTMLMSMVLTGFVVVFVIFSAFLWKEVRGDEREIFHRLAAGRMGFFVGAAILVLGIIFQSLRHELDPWLLLGLCGMVLGKLITRLYKEIRG